MAAGRSEPRGADTAHRTGPRLFGRDELLARIDSLLARPERAIQLLGAIGVGKTKVLREVARARNGSVRLVDLREVPTRRGVRACLDAANESLRTLADVLCIDHADAHRAEVERWLTEAVRRPCIVATRQRLHVDGLVVVPVLPLAIDVAVEWFLERARELNAEFVGEGEERTAIERLVQAVEGLPLAIEMLAAYVRVASPSRLLEPCDSPFDLLLTHRSPLRNALETAWRSLDATQRRALAMCASFEAPFSHDGFDGVLARTTGRALERSDTLAALGDLVDASWLEPVASTEGDARFRMSNVTRAFVRQNPWARRHARRDAVQLVEHYHAAVRERTAALVGPDARVARRWLVREMPNLEVALRTAAWAIDDPKARADAMQDLALALDAAITMGRPLSALRPSLDAALEAVAKVRRSFARDPRPARLLLARSETHLADGAHRDAEADVSEAEARSGEEPALAIAIAVARGRCHWYRGELDHATEWFSAALARARARGDAVSIARAAHAMGYAMQLAGRLDDAERFTALALAESQRAGDAGTEDAVRVAMASIALDRGEEQYAIEEMERLRVRFEESGDRRKLAAVLGDLSYALLARGPAHAAREPFETHLAITVSLGLRPTESLARAYVGCCLEECGDTVAARAMYAQAIETARTSGNRIAEGLALAWCGRLEARRGQIAAAQRALDLATECFELSNDRVRWEVAYLCRGHLEIAQAKEAEAQGRFDDAAALRHHARERASSARAALRTAVPESDERGSFASRSADVRQSLRMLEAALPGEVSRAPSLAPPPAFEPDADALVIAEDAAWFRPPRAREVHLRTRRSLRLVLALLARMRREAPGTAADLENLFAAGWPGERALSPSRASRVYVALSTLRGLGLRDVLIRRHDGYLLSIDVPLVEA